MFTFTEIEGLIFSFEPCPFCGGKPEWVVVPGEDYIMRCIQCHSATKRARMKPEEAVRDWNRGEIEEGNLTITSDKRIDEYLHGIRKVLFSGYLPNEFPAVPGGFLCSEAMIVTDEMNLGVEPDGHFLLYDKWEGFSPDLYEMPIADDGVEINFKSSSWDGKYLTAVRFQCEDTTVTLSANEEEQCMLVTFEDNAE